MLAIHSFIHSCAYLLPCPLALRPFTALPQQVVAPLDKKKVDPSALSLVECGPRFCLNPVKIFAGSFGGRTLYENPEYQSPNAVRAAIKKAAGGKYAQKVAAKARRHEHTAAHPMPRNELDTEEVFK